MNLPWPRILMGLLTVSVLAAGTIFTARTHANPAATYDSMQAFGGSWIAKTPGEDTPYLVLRFGVDKGKLTGTTTHFKIKLIGKGAVTGSPDPARPGESHLGDLRLWGSDLGFTWDGDSRLQTVPAKFMLQGSQQALLVLLLSSEKIQAQQEIMKESPGATGFKPAILLRREMETGDQGQAESATQHWEAGFMARLINTAEVQYKFANGHYADYHTLVASGQLKDTDQHEFTVLPDHYQSETNPLSGYRLRLLLSPDANSYQLSIQEKAADCGMNIFTDETGIIFEGHAAECQENSREGS